MVMALKNMEARMRDNVNIAVQSKGALVSLLFVRLYMVSPLRVSQDPPVSLFNIKCSDEHPTKCSC